MSADTSQTGSAEQQKDALEREIDQARDALVDTVDAIVDRVTPAKVVDRRTEQAKRDTARAAEDVRARAEALQRDVRRTVEEDPRRAATIAAVVLAVLLVPVVWGRRAGWR